MKVKIQKLQERERIVTLDALYTATASLHGRQAIKAFLRDLLTPSERVMLGRRILIARMLLNGYSYREIARRLGMGIDTVHKIQRLLYDQVPGYEDAVKGIEKEMGRRKGKRIFTDEPYRHSLGKARKKYPFTFLLGPLKESFIKDTDMYPRGR